MYIIGHCSLHTHMQTETCNGCRRVLPKEKFYPSKLKLSRFRCKCCTANDSKISYARNAMANRLANNMRRKLKGIVKRGAVTARRLLLGFNRRSALSGATTQLTARVWDTSQPISDANMICLTNREAFFHEKHGGKCSYPVQFQQHVDSVLASIAKEQDDSGLAAMANASGGPPHLSDVPSEVEVKVWTRAVCRWWVENMKSAPPPVVLREMIDMEERFLT